MKKITLIVLALSLNVSFSQTILEENFNTYDTGVVAAGWGDGSLFESSSNTTEITSCGTNDIPVNQDIQIIDNAGDKYVAFYDNGNKCKADGVTPQANPAICHKKLPELTADTFYTVTFEAWYDSNVEPATSYKVLNLQIRNDPSDWNTRLEYFKYGADGTTTSHTSPEKGALYLNAQNGYNTTFAGLGSGTKLTYVAVFKTDEFYDASFDPYYFVVTKPHTIYDGTDLGGDANTTSHYAIDNLKIEVGNLLSTGVELSKYGFSLFPNPTSGVINFKANEAVSHIEIFNTLGQQVFSKNLDLTNGQLDVSHLNNGIYSIKATINQQTGTMKFIKK